MEREIISTDKAPQAIGTYSQAVKTGNTVYLSGQIPLNPKTMKLTGSNMREQITQVFENLNAICQSAGGSLADIIKLNIYLTDLGHFSLVNEIMADYFTKPYPARAVVGVAALPKDVMIEMDAIMVIDE